MNVVESHHLTKSYGRIKALDDLSFSIEENKITGLIGRNGAGKTTLLKIIVGYLMPTGGELLVYGRKPFNSLFVSQKVMFVDYQMAFPAAFTLEDIIKEAGAFYPDFDSTLAYGLADYFSINLHQRHGNLSKGTKSTFNAIIGLSSHCPLTLFDEPTTGMDAAVRKDFYRAMLKDYLAHPRTILLSSHLLSEVEELLEDILLIDRGRKCLQLPVVELS